ncbi:MAG: oxygen-dependent coproporphyrinogen oxidase [Bacteroidales bacterium]|nr:oxygen-dependent coproporphyrinogen oxidase [Bacteroidales bacterium]MCF8338789.1 oxygen-dependent coproporphyrinogen oxidase [Bacteroidales bacterium]
MQHIDKVSSKFEKLQEHACNIIEKSDGSGTFTKDSWQKDIGKGITRVITNGDKISKGAVNFSRVSGPLSKEMSKSLGIKGEHFTATGLSSIFHAVNPFVPTIHMNVRYFRLDNGTEWFGGGIDLTPIYVDVEQAKNFHLQLKNICDKYDSTFYPYFKKWADDYFYSKHRSETRGVGGIFFDRQKPSKTFDFEKWMSFTANLAEAYPEIYTEMLAKNARKPYTEKNIFWQKIRWAKYAEFNLLFDRGTRFGIESGGNTESILISLPPEVRWEYNYTPEKGSKEEQTQQFLKKNIDWINLPEA